MHTCYVIILQCMSSPVKLICVYNWICVRVITSRSLPRLIQSTLVRLTLAVRMFVAWCDTSYITCSLYVYKFTDLESAVPMHFDDWVISLHQTTIVVHTTITHKLWHLANKFPFQIGEYSSSNLWCKTQIEFIATWEFFKIQSNNQEHRC